MNSKPLLAISLLTNFALAGWIFYSSNKTTATADTPNQPAPRKVEATAKPPTGRTITVTNSVEQKFDWRAVESADYKEYIANLRSIGCPEETIRDIIIADVNKLFEARRKELGMGKKFEYWKSGNMFAAMFDEEMSKKREALAKEKKALIEELLGIEWNEATDLAAVANPMTQMLDFLSEDKQAQVGKMMHEYQQKAMKSLKGGTPDAQDLKEMMKVQKEFEAELAKVLTPQELEDYNLRLSQTSMMMRMQLGSFEPSEQEFKDLFKLRKGFDDEFGWFGAGALTKEERDKKSVAEKEMKEQIKSLLGPERYADYERATDWTYQGIAKITERNGLSKEVAIDVFEMDKMSKEQIRNVRQDQNLDAAKREELIKQIKAETQASIHNALGDTAYQAYTNRPGYVP